jgi:hypothetical protein
VAILRGWLLEQSNQYLTSRALLQATESCTEDNPGVDDVLAKKCLRLLLGESESQK